jgi:hypothetical protein
LAWISNRADDDVLHVRDVRGWNVPILGSEQMYQALRTLNVPTQPVVYPGQTHSLTKLSFQRDRLERYLAWYAKYLGEDARPTRVAQP